MIVEGDYTCEICGASFETNVEIAGHTRAHQSSVSPEELRRAIQRLAGEKGRPPTAAEMDDEGEYSTFPVAKQFGSWTEGLKAAGIEPTREVNISKSAIVEAIIKLAERKSRTPTTMDMRKEGRYSPTTVRKRFDSWEKALAAAGFEPNIRIDTSEQELIESFRQLANELGRQPTAVDMDEQGAYSTKHFQQRFGSCNSAVRVAGYEPHVRRNIPKEDLLAEIERLIEELGQVPSASEMIAEGKYSLEPYRRQFGDWKTTMKAAGYEPPGQPRGPDSPNWTGGHSDWYGANWYSQRKCALERDGYRCQAPGCGMTNDEHRESFTQGIEVHHIVPLRCFSLDEETNEYPQGHALDNLITLCVPHHMKWEQIAPLRPDTRHLDCR